MSELIDELTAIDELREAGLLPKEAKRLLDPGVLRLIDDGLMFKPSKDIVDALNALAVVAWEQQS